MIRVTTITAGDGVGSLRVEGRLTHQTVEELRMACEAVLTDSRELQLDLSGLHFVDAAGAALLHGLEQQGTRLAGCSGFISELLRERRRTASASEAGRAPLVERLRAGDAEAFEAVVRQYGGRMLATARRFVGSDDDARDVVQDAFLAAFRALDGFAGAAQLSTWLHRIVINAALMKLRSRRRRREEPIEALLPRFDDEGRWAEPASPEHRSAEDLLQRREVREMVRDAVDRLPVNYRTVLVMRDIEELDTDETASLLGITPNAVKTRLHRARQALRTLLDRELVKESRRSEGRSGAVAACE